MRDFFVKLLCLIKTNAVKGVLLLAGWFLYNFSIGYSIHSRNGFL